MYQCFSIVYGVDIDSEKLERSPNAFWILKSDDASKKPSVGQIKPQVDISQTLELVKSELILWLETKGIKAGAVGQLTGQNFASAVSKIVDEMDTVEDRKKQVVLFQAAEQQLWNLILNYMHPVWAKAGIIENKKLFNPKAEIKIEFPEQIPLITRDELVQGQKIEVEAGFTSRKRAIRRLNPSMKPSEIDELISEIDEERSITIEEQIDVSKTPESSN
jgi:hypothetical protein